MFFVCFPCDFVPLVGWFEFYYSPRPGWPSHPLPRFPLLICLFFPCIFQQFLILLPLFFCFIILYIQPLYFSGARFRFASPLNTFPFVSTSLITTNRGLTLPLFSFFLTALSFFPSRMTLTMSSVSTFAPHTSLHNPATNS